MLHLDRVGIHGNLWGLDGHSLLAAKALARVNDGLSIDPRLQALFKWPAIAGFTAAIGGCLLAGAAAPKLVDSRL